MPSPALRPIRTRLMVGAILLPLAALAGCAQTTGATDPVITGAIAHPVSDADYQQAVIFWGQRYSANPKDHDATLNYGNALLHTNQAQAALVVLQGGAINFPNDRAIMAALGKAFAGTGNFQQALVSLHAAEDPAHPDWKLMSAEGAILDQSGQSDAARKLYDQALALAPNDPSILSNYGMSYVMTGDLTMAEKLLRRAMAAANADPRVRQNLALVVGLEGRFDEAQKIASADLSPDEAAANVAYLKQMLASQQNSWQALKSGKTS
ncbi:MAG TPA: tetratricopeptide repeat protein [Bauldia sp.]|nr:tetratricopeptide repeat protein [Bauldia sp.]